MNKAKQIALLTKDMDKRTERYKKTVAYLECRARPGQVKTVSVVIRKNKNYGLGKGYGNRNVTLIAGKCPCSVCGHEWMWQCEDENCQCCSSVCT